MYTPTMFRTKKTRHFLKKITGKEHKRITALYASEGNANRITVRTKSGKTLDEEVIFPKGHPKNPLTDGEVEHKFRKLTKRFLGERRTDEALSLLWSLEKVRDLSELTATLVVK